MMGNLYAALRQANVPDDKARQAAEEVAEFQTKLSAIDGRLMLLQWMIGFNLALTVAIVAKLFLG